MPNEGQEWIEGEIAFHRDGYGQWEVFQIFGGYFLVYAAAVVVLILLGIE